MDNILKKLKSDEEKEFYAWLLEAEQHNLISDIQYEPEPFILSDKKHCLKNGKVRHLLHPHKYTPDFKFILEKKLDCFYPLTGDCYVDTKGTWANRGASQEFSINQKWVYEKFNIYINKVIPKKFFHKTWVPEYARLTKKTRVPVKAYVNCISINEFMALNF